MDDIATLEEKAAQAFDALAHSAQADGVIERSTAIWAVEMGHALLTKRAKIMAAIEFGRYLANAAEQYADCMNNPIDDDETTDKYLLGMRSAIHEFRKRLPQPPKATANE